MLFKKKWNGYEKNSEYLEKFNNLGKTLFGGSKPKTFTTRQIISFSRKAGCAYNRKETCSAVVNGGRSFAGKDVSLSRKGGTSSNRSKREWGDVSEKFAPHFFSEILQEARRKLDHST